ncbi:hypothetical protein G5714_002795 [Onychostoma macrolepis]|uniref:Uncharacterized protein n=1 Tax=Onychostoma macrolepis TaxID=369639 RepID=A0A7J6D7P6_9TELE|nr:hypothetical protein G5714_002795 [Onychostoma macrolepis]
MAQRTHSFAHVAVYGVEQNEASKYVPNTLHKIPKDSAESKKETESLQDMKQTLAVDDGVLHQWVTDVQEWAHTTTNKGRNKIRRKINEERKKLASAIEQHNALVDASLKIVSIEEVLQNDYVFPWQLTEQDDVNLLTKKKVFDKVMVIQRLEEEQTILVQEAKQHWLYLRSQEHKLNRLLDNIISGGLQCVLQKKLHQLKAHQDTVKTSYQTIDTITEHITGDECEYSSWPEHLEALYSSSTDLSSDEDDMLLL